MVNQFRNESPLDPDEILANSISTLEDGAMESHIERPLGRISSLLLLVVMGGGILYLASVSAVVQVRDGDDFFAKSQENRFLTRWLSPPRGSIVDRFGNPFVENIPSFGFVFERGAFRAVDDSLESLLDNLSELLNEPRSFFSDAGFPDNPNEFLPSRIVISQDVGLEAVAHLAGNPERFPGVRAFEHFQRVYRDPYAFSHLIGFIGKISEEDLLKNSKLKREDMIGKSGIELWYDDLLRGSGGRKLIEVDSRGQETRFKLTREYVEGAELHLTVDGEFQSAIHDILSSFAKRKKNASIVALDPRDGSVRALLSYPGFDINRFGSSLTIQEFETIVRDPLKPFFNRALSGEYPSGSVIKPFLAAAALEENIVDPAEKMFTEGFISIPNPYNPDKESIFLDWKNHGWVNLYDALAFSSNVYFYTIGGGYEDQEGLGIERIRTYAMRFGFGSSLGIDLPGERAGFIPSPESKRITEPEDPIWRIGDTYNVSIGQGNVRVTPLQMTAAIAVIANGGTLYAPRVLDRTRNNEKEIRNRTKIVRKNIVGEKSLTAVVRGMHQAAQTGTAGLLSSIPMKIGAKTGTAQAPQKSRPVGR